MGIEDIFKLEEALSTSTLRYQAFVSDLFICYLVILTSHGATMSRTHRSRRKTAYASADVHKLK